MLTWLRANVMTAAALVLAVLLGLQTWLRHTEQLEHRDLIAQVAQDKAARTGAALKYELKTSSAEGQHAKNTQENSDAFTTSQPTRDAIARADLAVVERLRRAAERRAEEHAEHERRMAYWDRMIASGSPITPSMARQARELGIQVRVGDVHAEDEA